MKSYFELMASYNSWMNKSVYEAASRLGFEECEKDRGAFFGSIIGTLNHILVGDTIWLKRFADHETIFSSLDYVRSIEAPKSLDEKLYSTLAQLETERTNMDKVIVEFASELTDNAIASSLSYKNTNGEPFVKSFGHLLQHFFNHQTHHRGQVSTLLCQAGEDAGITDLVIGIPNVSMV